MKNNNKKKQYSKKKPDNIEKKTQLKKEDEYWKRDNEEKKRKTYSEFNRSETSKQQEYEKWLNPDETRSERNESETLRGSNSAEKKTQLNKEDEYWKRDNEEKKRETYSEFNRPDALKKQEYEKWLNQNETRSERNESETLRSSNSTGRKTQLNKEDEYWKRDNEEKKRETYSEFNRPDTLKQQEYEKWLNQNETHSERNESETLRSSNSTGRKTQLNKEDEYWKRDNEEKKRKKYSEFNRPDASKQQGYEKRNPLNETHLEFNKTNEIKPLKNTESVNGINTIVSDNYTSNDLCRNTNEKDTLVSPKKTMGAGNRIIHTGVGVNKIISQGAYHLYQMGVENTEVYKGYQTYAEYGGTAALVCADALRKTMALSLQHDAKLSYKSINEQLQNAGVSSKMRFITNPIDDKQFKTNINVAFKYLDMRGILKKSSRRSGEENIYVASKVKIIRRRKMNALDKEILKLYKKMSRVSVVQNHKKFRVVKQFARIAKRTARQDVTLNAVILFESWTRRSRGVAKTGFKLLGNALYIAKCAGKLTYKATLKAALFTKRKLAQTKIGMKAAEIPFVKVLGNGARKTQNAGRRASGAVRSLKNKFSIRKRYSELKIKIKNLAMKPFRFMANALRNRLMRSKYGKAFLNGVNRIGSFFNGAGRVLNFLNPFRIVGKLFATLKTIFVMIAAIGLIGIVILWAIFFMLGGIFDFTTAEKDIREEALSQIEKCYQEDQATLQNLTKQYSSVTVTYEDKKDYNAYQKHEFNSGFNETTNTAELLSMAYVYFDFDLEEAGKRKVKNYVKEMYYGSHLATLQETGSYEDDDGNIYKSCEVTYTTYYFNELFSCKRTKNKMSLGSGTGIISGNDTTEKTWNFLRTAGYTPIQTAAVMGNIWAESHFDPSIIEHGNGIGFGLCQWSYGRRTNLENFAASQGKPASDLEIQLRFLQSELNEAAFCGYTSYYNSWKNSTDINEATKGFCLGWERPNIAYARLDERYQAANLYYNTYKDRKLPTE